MEKVKAKKYLGQHFLEDLSVSERIASLYDGPEKLLEVGPGMGVLSQYLVSRTDLDLHLVEIDSESVEYLKKHFSIAAGKLFEADFLKMDLNEALRITEDDKFGVIGNFPYNISSQIFFKVLDYKNQVEQVVGMVQKEVGQRIASPPGNKDYGILSVLLQAYYDISYGFTVPPSAFNPPPKVDSGVIKLVRNHDKNLNCDYKKFKLTVKTGFNQRRKKLSNALKPISQGKELPYADKRAEQLDYIQFSEITRAIFN